MKTCSLKSRAESSEVVRATGLQGTASLVPSHLVWIYNDEQKKKSFKLGMWICALTLLSEK